MVEGAKIAGVGTILTQHGNALDRLATKAGLRVVAEAFADRAYRGDGRLVPRGTPEALLGPDAAEAQAVALATEGAVTAIDGTRVPVATESICVHGDSPGAVEVAASIRAALDERGIDVEAFS